jgi:hypothetical protein
MAEQIRIWENNEREKMRLEREGSLEWNQAIASSVMRYLNVRYLEIECSEVRDDQVPLLYFVPLTSTL